MSEKEETVFETLNRLLADMRDQLGVTNEALIVISIEFSEAHREFGDILKKMNTLLAKLAETEVPVETKEVSVVQESERFQELVFPKSTPTKAEGEKK